MELFNMYMFTICCMYIINIDYVEYYVDSVGSVE